MAISQKKYVEIGSTVTVSAPGLPIRGLFVIPANVAATTGNNGKIILDTVPSVFTNAEDAVASITASTDAAKAVKDAFTKYFSAVGSTGRSPSSCLAIAMTATTGTVQTAVQAAVASGEPFQCVCIVVSGTTATDVTNAIAACDNQCIVFSTATGTVSSVKSGFAKTLSDADTRFSNVTYAGNNVAASFAGASAAVMGILCATDYDQTGSAPTLMYKTANGVSASVTTDSDYDDLVDIRCNFFGLTKTYGSSYTFYQRGVNGDGTDTAIEMNDIWLRGTITRGIMTLLTNMPKIPANATGVSSIYTVVDSAAQKGLDNGVILANKTLSAEKRALVLNYARGDEEAVNDVQSQGYHISCQLVETSNEYECKYVLIYSKGDAIKKIVGTHVLI